MAPDSEISSSTDQIKTRKTSPSHSTHFVASGSIQVNNYIFFKIIWFILIILKLNKQMIEFNQFDCLSFQKRLRKNPRPKRSQKHPRVDKAAQEVKSLQSSVNCLISKAAFRRLAVEILRDFNPDARFSKIGLQALQESSEMYTTTLFEDALYLASHRARKTVQSKDLLLAKHITAKKWNQ